MSYILNESNYQKNNPLAEFLSFIGGIIFSDIGSVSALAASDLEQGQYTCPRTNSNSYCQPMPASDCNSDCAVPCIPKPINEVPSCRGVCIDNRRGTCAPNSPQEICQGNWTQGPIENIQQCTPGCCLLGAQISMINDLECGALASSLGIQKIFRPDVRTVEACRSLTTQQLEGACVYSIGNEKSCRFVSRETCEKSIHGSFFENTLCTNTALNTTCEKEKTTRCVDTIDGSKVYWFDSCGNKENIYSLPRGASWNNGIVLNSEQSCNLRSSGERNCGNCNILEGSTCGRTTSAGEVSVGDFVCKKAACIDENGKERQHLESWCTYQGAIGLDVGKNRASDPAGSRHFRSTCSFGEVKQDPCGDYRNGICVETKNNVVGSSTFSTASCRINMWQLCETYNLEEDKDKVLKKCVANPDCFVKSVNVAEKFNFNVCAPKYPPGFDLTENARGEGGEAFCNFATQTCTYIKVKGVFSDKVINKNCLTSAFTEQMNDLCTSLGDCGGKVNYVGTFSSSYSVSNAPELSQGYISSISSYKNKVPGRVASPGNPAFFGLIGIPSDLGYADIPADASLDAQSNANTAGMLMGLGSIAIFGAFKLGLVSGAGALGGSIGPPTAFASGLSAAAGALVGAAIGLAFTAFLIKITGIGPGLEDWMTYSLLAAGALGGLMIGYAFTQSAASGLAALGSTFSSGAGTLGAAGPVGWIILAVVIVIIVILKLIGVGKITKINVKFTCKPWQAPTGGTDCSKCGKDGFPCTSYSCSSLGQTCEVINENSDYSECVDIGRNDTLPPVIKPYYGILGMQYNYTNVSDNGYRLIGPLGCLSPGSQVLFGVSLNEAGQCKYSTEHKSSFEEMVEDFGESSLFRHNHSELFTVPTMESLGVNSNNPNAKVNYNMYVRCQDKKGNNNVQEYVVQMCIGKGIDVTPPIITAKIPNSEFFAWNATSAAIRLFTNEPSECNWDRSDKAYELMANNLTCADWEDEPTPFLGWECNSIFPIEKNKTDIFVRCRDQPELFNRTVYQYNINGYNVSFQDNVDQNEVNRIDARTRGVGFGAMFSKINFTVINEAKVLSLIENGTNRTQIRNVNMDSYNFSLRRSNYALKIENVYPTGILEYGNEPRSVELGVEVSGGVNGRATCAYTITAPYLNLGGDVFTPPGQVYHKSNLLLYSGLHEVNVRCVDIVGNAAEKTTRFTMKLDTSAPVITRIYSNLRILTVITDEPSTCAAMPSDNCALAFTNGTLLSGTNTNRHTMLLTKEHPYYISCKDEYGWSTGSLCNAIVKI